MQNDNLKIRLRDFVYSLTQSITSAAIGYIARFFCKNILCLRQKLGAILVVQESLINGNCFFFKCIIKNSTILPNNDVQSYFREK